MRLFKWLWILGLASQALASVSVTVNGTNYTIPQTNEKGWGTSVTSWIQATSQYTLQPTGGTFSLSSELDFGSSFGIKSLYYKSRTSNLSTAGIIRFANTDAIGWRNSGNGGNLLLSPNVSTDGVLQYNSVDLVGTSLSQTLTSKTISGSSNTLSNIPNSATTASASAGNSTIVARDGSGNFAAGTITAALTGTASGNTSYTPNQYGVVLSGSGNVLSVLAPDASTSKVLTSAGASANPTWQDPATSPTSYQEISNLGLATSVGSNALSIALKQGDGSTNCASGAGACKIGFRSSTVTSGAYNQRSVTGALSTVISSGSTAGHLSAKDEYIYVYAIDNAGTVELAWSSTRLWDEGSVQTTTAEGGAGAADSKVTLYSTTARSNVPVRFLARLKSNQSTAGTWAAAIAEISDLPSNRNKVSNSDIFLRDANGYGAVSTKIRRFSTTVKSTGTAITYADSANAAATFTINEDGEYAVTYFDQLNTTGMLGITLNDTELTTTLFSKSVKSEIIAETTTTTANSIFTCSVTLPLVVGDVLRAHTNGDASGSSTGHEGFRITKVGD